MSVGGPGLLEKLAHPFTVDLLDDPAGLDPGFHRRTSLRHCRDDRATLDETNIEADLSRPLVGVFETLVELSRNDPEMCLVQPVDRLADRCAGILHARRGLDLRTHCVMNGLPIQTAELGVEVLVANCFPHDLERLDVFGSLRGRGR